MSEVADACQIVMLTGKGAYYLGKISSAAAMMVIKTMNTIYLAKWHGVTSLHRFRRIQGDDWTYINISTEDPAKLRGVYKEMTDHGLLLAQLPDLCGGDGRTQCVISPKDAEKFKAFLLDHANGKYKDIKVGPISAEDYARTGYDSKGKETPEMADLSASAKENQKRLTGREPAGLLGVSGGGGNWTWGNFTYSEMNAGAREAGFNRNTDNYNKRQSANYAQDAKERNRRDGSQSRNSGGESRASNSENFQQSSDMHAIKYFLQRHDEEINRGSGAKWITEPPFKEHEKWSMYVMPDGIHAVVIPNEDRYQMQSPEGGIMYRAAVRPNNFYNVINLANGEMQLKDGEQISVELDKTSISKENEELKNTIKNLGLPDLSGNTAFEASRANTVSFASMGFGESVDDQRHGIADDLYTTIRINSLAAFQAGLVDGPYSIIIPDSAEKEGFRQLSFLKSDCVLLPDGHNTEIHIPAERSDRHEDETLRVNNKMLDSVVFAPTDGKNGISIAIPGETRDDPVLTMSLQKPYDYDKSIDGTILEMHIDPEKTYKVNFVGPDNFNHSEEITGKDIISQYNISESRIESENAVRNALRGEFRTDTAEVMPSNYSRGIADDLFTTIRLNPDDAFSAGMVNGPYSMPIPDSSEKEGFRQVTFYKSDCTMLPDGQNMDVHIPAERSSTNHEETFRVNKDITSSYVIFGSDETEKGVSISIPGETASSPTMSVSLQKPYDYDRESSGQKLEIHIDPEKSYEVKFTGLNGSSTRGEMRGKEILALYQNAESRAYESNPVENTVRHIANNIPSRNSRNEGSVPSGR